MTDASNDAISQALTGADSETGRSPRPHLPGIFGLITNRYMHEYGLDQDELARFRRASQTRKGESLRAIPAGDQSPMP